MVAARCAQPGVAGDGARRWARRLDAVEGAAEAERREMMGTRHGQRAVAAEAAEVPQRHPAEAVESWLGLDLGSEEVPRCAAAEAVEEAAVGEAEHHELLAELEGGLPHRLPGARCCCSRAGARTASLRR